MKRTVPALLLLPALVMPCGPQSGRGEGPGEELFRTIASLDRVVFDAVNRCDLPTLATFIADDLEFYHDNGGLVHRSRENFLASDVSAFIEHTREAVELAQDQVVVITPTTIEITDFDGNSATGKDFHIDWDSTAA